MKHLSSGPYLVFDEGKIRTIRFIWCGSDIVARQELTMDIYSRKLVIHRDDILVSVDKTLNIPTGAIQLPNKTTPSKYIEITLDKMNEDNNRIGLLIISLMYLISRAEFNHILLKSFGENVEIYEDVNYTDVCHIKTSAITNDIISSLKNDLTLLLTVNNVN